jgi:hypothetical protein
MPIKKFNSKDGYSINDPPVDLIDNAGNYNTTTGNITAVNGTFTGDVSAVHFNGDFIGELQVECKNTSGSIIPKGTPVYITGTVGATNVIEVSPSNAGNSATMPAVGLTTEQIAINGTGHVTLIGIVQGMNTNSYIVGQTLYVAVGGGLTNVKPTGATELIQNIGKVGRVNTNNGEIIVTGPGRTNDVPNTISIPGALTVGGNLTVNGTTTTINSTITTLDDPIITLGGDTAPTVDDNKDRGIEYRWHNGTTSKLGFFGFDDSTGKFTFIPDATNTNEVFSGALGTIDVNSVHINGSQIAASNLSNGTTGTGAIVLQTSPSFIASVTTSSTSLDVFDTTATTVNAFGAATTLNLGQDASSGTTTTNINVKDGGTSTVNIATGSAGTRTINLATGNTAGSNRTINFINSIKNNITSNNIDFDEVSFLNSIDTNTGYGQVNILANATGSALYDLNYVNIGTIDVTQVYLAGGIQVSSNSGLDVFRDSFNKDHIIILPRNGGTFIRSVTITNEVLTANRTFTLPNVNGTAITTGNLSSITSTGTLSSLSVSGSLTASSGITFSDGTTQITRTPDFLLFSVGII